VTKAPTTASGYYQVGTVVTLTTQPTTPASFHFGGWSGDAQVIGPYNTLKNPVPVSVEGTMNITATHIAGASAVLTLTQPTIPGGTGNALTQVPTFSAFNPDNNGGEGDFVTITAAVSTKPAVCPPGYEFKNWTGDTLNKSTKNSPAIFFMPSNRTISAVYGLKTYALTRVVKPTAGAGSITASGTSPYDTNTVVTIEAIPNGTNVFLGWSGAVTGTTNPTTVTMTAAKSVTATFEVHDVTITKHMPQGWSMVSVPTTPANDSAAVIFTGKFGDMFAYQGGGYVKAPRLTVGYGYWAYYTVAQDVSITGPVQATIQPVLTQGWNLVGSREDTVLTSELTTAPAGLIFGDLFRYASGSYAKATDIKSAEGVWIYVTGACTLTIP